MEYPCIYFEKDGKCRKFSGENTTSYRVMGPCPEQKLSNDPRCQCSECGSIETPLARHRFCPACGAPMTDEAVQMVMERLEALYE